MHDALTHVFKFTDLLSRKRKITPIPPLVVIFILLSHLVLVLVLRFVLLRFFPSSTLARLTDPLKHAQHDDVHD